MYNPKPVDTSDIILSADLIVLTERIAENVHDVWAVGKLAEGWTYGKVVDAEKKHHPSLVPYDQLSETEKDYDRDTALGTLKLIQKLGYVIKKA